MEFWNLSDAKSEKERGRKHLLLYTAEGKGIFQYVLYLKIIVGSGVGKNRLSIVLSLTFSDSWLHLCGRYGNFVYFPEARKKCSLPERNNHTICFLGRKMEDQTQLKQVTTDQHHHKKANSQLTILKLTTK